MSKDSFKSKKVNFTQVSNSIILDDTISLKAKGLYGVIQHYITIPNFILYLNTLKKTIKEGDHTFNTAWKELKEKGYLLQERKRDSKTGKFYYLYELLDIPNPPHSDFPHTDNPQSGNPPYGKPPIYNNTDINNTDLINTNKNNNNYKEQGPCSRLSFSEIIKTNTFTGHKKYIEAKEKVVDMYFEQYQNYTGYSKHFEVKSKQWENINEALDYSFEFAEINKLNVKKIFTELLDVNFSTENKKGYDSLQGFLSIGRIKYLLYKLEYLDVTEVFDITGQFDETL